MIAKGYGKGYSAAAIAVGLAVAVPAGWLLADARQRIHDAAAYASIDSRADLVEYARWGSRGDEARAALRASRAPPR